MSRVEVSVVVSTYQRRAALRRTLDSLLGQRVPSDLRYEMIVVDNNSTDCTRDVVGGYARVGPSWFATIGTATGRLLRSQRGHPRRARPDRRVHRR